MKRILLLLILIVLAAFMFGGQNIIPRTPPPPNIFEVEDVIEETERLDSLAIFKATGYQDHQISVAGFTGYTLSDRKTGRKVFVISNRSTISTKSEPIIIKAKIYEQVMITRLLNLIVLKEL